MNAGAVTDTIRIPSSVKKIRQVSDKIIPLLSDRKIEKSDIFDIRLAVEEAVINAIEHGNSKNKGLSVEVSFTISADRIEVSIQDEGPGFDHCVLPDPTKDKNVLRAHGRGVYIMHKLMDEIHYNDKGNKVTLIKRFK